MIDDMIARINELAKKAKGEGLTQEEVAERDRLRRIYLDSVRANLTAQLDNTYLVDEKGNVLRQKDANPVGNLLEQPFYEIWQGAELLEERMQAAQ